MPYTAAQLTTLYTNLHMGLAPNALNNLKISGYADQNLVGGLSDAQTVTAVAQTGDMDVAVAASAYQFFTGKIPSETGMTYLVNSAVNTGDLNDPYYNAFNLENRYINFAFNLGLFGDGAAAFATAFGSLTFAQAVDAAYEKIIGSSFAASAGINPVVAKANITGRLSYFQAIADQNLSGATAAMKDLGAKAGMVGYIMAEALKADVGVYAIGINAFMTDLALDGKATFASDLIATYSVPANAVSQAKTLSLTTTSDTGAAFLAGAGNDTFAADLTATGAQTLNAGDNIDGGAGTNTLSATLKSSVTPAGLANIQIISVTNVDDGAGGTSPNLNLANAPSVTTVQVHDLGDPQGIQVTNIQTAASSFELSNVGGGDVTFQVKAAALAGSSDSATLTLNSVTAGTVTVGSGAAGSGYETLSIKSTGSSANTVAVVTDGASDKLTTLKITGGADLSFLSNVADKVTTVDASGLTGKLSIGFSNGTAVTVMGGSGDDTFIFAGTDYVGGATGSARDIIDGGAGTDTLAISAAAAIAQTTAQDNLTSIERLQLTTTLTASLDTTTLFSSITEIVFGATASAAATLTIDSGDTVTFLTSAASPTITVAGLGLSDTGKIKLGQGVTMGAITTSGLETVNLEVDAAGNSVGAITAAPTAASSTLKISGQGLLVTGPITADVIDASAMSGNGRLVMNVEGTTKVAITGSAGNDQLTGSTQNDLIIGGGGNDVLIGGGGIDILSLAGGGSDSVSLYGVTDSANRDRVSGFTSGTGPEADVIWVAESSTSAPTAAGASIAIQEVGAAPAATVAFSTAANDVLEFSFNLSGANGPNDLDNSADGAALLAVLGQSISLGAGSKGYAIAYQGGSAYLFHVADANSSGALAAAEIQLVGVFEGVAVGSLEAANFRLLL